MTPSVLPTYYVSGFTYASVSGLVLWLDSSTSSSSNMVISSGTTVSQWLDLSGLSHNTNAVVGSPKYANPGMMFDGASNFAIPLVVSSSWSIFAVISTTNQVSSHICSDYWYCGYCIFDAEVAGEANDFGSSIINGQWVIGVGNPDTSVISSTYVNTGDKFLVEFTRDSSTGTMINYVNGFSQGSATGGTGSKTASSRITIGAQQKNMNYFIGTIYEVIVYNVVLTTSQRVSLESYVYNKWNVPGLAH